MAHSIFKILIVDDEPKNIKLVASYLGVVKNYELSYTTFPKKALEMISEHKYDLILLDINMPVIDGYEVCKIIKKHPKTQHIPVMFLTAMLDDKSMENAFRVGAADYITKPIKKLELVSRVKTIFAFHKYEKEIKSLKNDLIFSELKNKTTIDVQTNPILFYKNEKILSCNKALQKLLGYSSFDNFLDKEKSITGFIYDSDCQALQLDDLAWIKKLYDEKDDKDKKHRVSILIGNNLKHFYVNVLKFTYDKHLEFIVYFQEIERVKVLFEKE